MKDSFPSLIGIVDYGAGNLCSVVNAFESIGQECLVTHRPEDLDKVRAIVLPGVGAFGDGMKKLKELRLVDELNCQVLIKKKPFLGICLGLQLLATEGFENGHHQGLNWIKGGVRKIEPENPKCRVPHMGWNEVCLKKKNPLFEGLMNPSTFYFVHSYSLHLAEEDVLTGETHHGAWFTASIQKDHIFGTQFHPEKSQKNGITVLKNFLKFVQNENPSLC